MLSCPHCHTRVDLRGLEYPGLFKDYRVCPHCNGKFTPDTATKKRQAIFIVIAMVSLLFTVLMSIDGTDWLIPSVVSYLVLAGLVYWGNRHIFLIPYNGRE